MEVEDDGSVRYNELQLVQAVCRPEELEFPDPADPYYFTLSIRDEDEGSSTCQLVFKLEENYPEVPLMVSVQGLARGQDRHFLDQLKACLAELGEGEMQVYAAFEWTQQHAKEFLETAPDPVVNSDAVVDEDNKEEEYKPPEKTTTLELMDETSDEGKQFMQALKASGLFFNYESITTHPLWDHELYSKSIRGNHTDQDNVWEYSDPSVGTIYLTRDPAKTAGISVYCTVLGWDLERAFFDANLPAEDSAWDTAFKADAAGVASFTNKLRQKKLPEILMFGAKALQAKLLEEAGFDGADDDLDEDTFNTVDDSVRKDMDGKFDPSRAFKIIIYGIHVNSPDFAKGRVSDPKFNWSALGLTGRGKGINTKKLDGRNSEVQGRISRSDGFRDWMEKKVQMIEEWFKDPENKGRQLTVAVFCSKGRHRSVSAAILLRDLFYPNAVCEGHGVVKGALRVVKPKIK